MLEPVTDDAFIVISGHPQSGKRERISRIRTHITKRYFRKLHHKTEGEQQLTLPCTIIQNRKFRSPNLSLIGNELCLPFTNYALLDPSPIFAAETARRMHKFFNRHPSGYVNAQPFFRSVVRWAVNDPHFASAKLLNASGWDDILESGELSIWTTRQRFITLRLLKDTLNNDTGAENKHATVAAVQSLFGFELLIGNNESINPLQRFHQSLIAKFSQPNDEVWTFLTRGHYFLSYTDRLRRRSGDNDHGNQTSVSPHLSEEVIPSNLYPDHQFAFPVDISLFTLCEPKLCEDHLLVCYLLGDLYRTTFLASSSQIAPLSRSTYENLVNQHQNLLSKIFEQGPTRTIADTNMPEDQRILSLRLSIFILTSCLLSSRLEEAEDHRQHLARLASRLRALLGCSINGVHDHSKWVPFSAALLWCCAIGLRFSGHCDRTWFLMQFMRVGKICLLETWEQTSSSMEVIVSALEQVGPVSVEPKYVI